HYLPLAEHPCPQTCLLTTREAALLTGAGISLTIYVGSLLVVAVLNLLLAAAMALILFVRRSHEVMALITAYFVLILPTTYTLNKPPIAFGTGQTTAFTLPLVLELALANLQTATIYGMFLLFPSGRFVPRWSWALLIAFTAYSQVFSALPALAGVLTAGFLLFLAGAGACIGFSFLRVSSLLSRPPTRAVL